MPTPSVGQGGKVETMSTPTSGPSRTPTSRGTGYDDEPPSYMDASFRPTHRIVMSELESYDRDYFFHLLAKMDPKFFLENTDLDPPADAGSRASAAGLKSHMRYVANVRLLAPGVEKWVAKEKKKRTVKIRRVTMTPREKLARRASQDMSLGNVTLTFEGAGASFPPLDVTGYTRFNKLFYNGEKEIRPKLRPLNWVMRLVEDIYDVRFTHDQQDLANEDIHQDDNAERLSNIFPVFVADYFSKRYGLKSLVEQTCAEVQGNVQLLRQDYSELEMFARFLEETYDADDLLFFLYVRSVLQKTLNVSLRSRWTSESSRVSRVGPPKLFMKHRECVAVARAVYESESDPMCQEMCRELLQLLRAEVQGAKRGSGLQGDTRRIEVQRFLFLALQCYHNGEAGADPTPRSGGRRISLREAMGESPSMRALDMSSCGPETSSMNIEDLDAYQGQPQQRGQGAANRVANSMGSGETAEVDNGVTLSDLSMSGIDEEPMASPSMVSDPDRPPRRPTRSAPPLPPSPSHESLHAQRSRE